MAPGFPTARYLSGREAAFIWNGIRLLRSNPPGFAVDDGLTDPDPERRRTFSAALEQFEQLMHAAAAAGAATRPIPLFYAIEQAGRAMLAAFEETNNWEKAERSREMHGLTLGAEETEGVLTRKVEPKRDGIFPRAAKALGIEGLSNPVELGALWSALPDLAETPLPDERWRRPIRASIPPATPPEYAKWDYPFPGAKLVLAVPWVDSLDQSVLRALLNDYPTAEGWLSPKVVGAPEDELAPATVSSPFSDWGGGVLLRWPQRGNLDEIAPQHRYEGERWLRPGLNEAVGQPSPLFVWWALLYGLSILARYHPRPWADELAIDRSRRAVPLEDALEEALAAVPHLVLEALRQRPVLLRLNIF